MPGNPAASQRDEQKERGRKQQGAGRDWRDVDFGRSAGSHGRSLGGTIRKEELRCGNELRAERLVCGQRAEYVIDGETMEAWQLEERADECNRRSIAEIALFFRLTSRQADIERLLNSRVPKRERDEIYENLKQMSADNPDMESSPLDSTQSCAVGAESQASESVS